MWFGLLINTLFYDTIFTYLPLFIAILTWKLTNVYIDEELACFILFGEKFISGLGCESFFEVKLLHSCRF